MEDRKSPLVSIGHDSSDFLKGIAIFGVLLSHTGHIFTEFSIVLFLVISGFGLELSYRKKGFAGFWGKKFRNVWLPYFPMAFVALVLRHVTAPDEILCTLVGLDFGRIADKTMWYISYIFAWYAAFFLMGRLTEKFPALPERSRFALRLAGAVAAGFLFCLLYNRGVWHENSGADNYRYAFPLGMLLAELTSIRADSRIGKAGWGIVLLGCAVYVIRVYPRPFHIPTNMALAMVFVALTQIVPVSGKGFLPLRMVGRYSFAIYLWEGLLLGSREFFYNLTGSQLGADCGFIAASILFGFLYWELVFRPGERFLERKLSERAKG